MRKIKKSRKDKESKNGEIARHYGFNRIEPPVINKGDNQKVKTLQIALLRLYEEKNMANLPQPIMLFFEGKTTEKYFDLEILDCAKAISEATVIQTALAILREQGYKNLYVDINSLGDRESTSRFFRELGNFCHKHLDILSVDCRQAVKRDAGNFFHCCGEKNQALLEEAPKSVAFLSELAKSHFKEVLEYLEALNIPYRINNALLGNRQLVTHTVFEIRDLKNESDEPALAFGFRYNGLARKIGMKKEIPALGIAITVKNLIRNRKVYHETKKPQVFFAQIGVEAKLKSLKVMEMLRQAHIRVHQSLTKDKISSQIAVAENMKIPFIIIMGQKETLDNTVIVRNMANRSQEVVPIPKLANYLKHLK